jgi:hypothetical protein
VDTGDGVGSNGVVHLRILSGCLGVSHIFHYTLFIGVCQGDSLIVLKVFLIRRKSLVPKELRRSGRPGRP